MDKCMQKFLNNMFFSTPHITGALNKELSIILRYLGKMSQIVKLGYLRLRVKLFQS